jgi:hypothetical protein
LDGQLNRLAQLSNVLYLISYSMRDILWLRILTVVAASLLIPVLCDAGSSAAGCDRVGRGLYRD